MNQNSTHDIGTVKNNSDAYEEFFVSVGRAYLVKLS